MAVPISPCPENFELTEEDELTLKGFIDLHIMTAEDPEGGERELWVVMAALGYNHQLQLNQVSMLLVPTLFHKPINRTIFTFLTPGLPISIHGVHRKL